MSTTFEWHDVEFLGVEGWRGGTFVDGSDEEDGDEESQVPEGKVAITLSTDEVAVLVGTPEQLVDAAKRILAVAEDLLARVETDDDDGEPCDHEFSKRNNLQRCVNCGVLL